MIESSQVLKNPTRLNYGMVGGGEGSFIGDVHRKAIGFDGKADLACGCFSQNEQTTLDTGLGLGISQDRLYKNFEDMAREEGSKQDKIDFVVIVTPNITHFPIAKAFLEAGINVVSDKPVTVSAAEAAELEKLSRDKNLHFCVTYTYTGYPMVKHAREMIQQGVLGDIRFVNAEYPQDWLGTLLEETGQKQASWRSDPARTGASNCVGDIGSHVENMISYLTGLKIKRLCARLDTMVEGRILDDNASIMLDYDSGAKGLYWCSQIAVGHDNDFRVRIYGSKASIEWSQEDPNYLKISYLDKPTETLSRGRDELSEHAGSYPRIPSGHPEGYYEAFANIYKTYVTMLIKQKEGEPLTDGDLDFPGIEDGLQGVTFIEKCVESSKKDAAWLDFES
ncbi:MAG: Gfo/Idh/MocA family oxidoreductase [Deltaproteobacteria bacterium]|nr:Gfo/Idh/MocA family oxidoreductase [Deltaproteobacteria bacterium]MBT4644698.1 Gfo/Idh/MocA family oxidoreductase [Deltaproteobacteria bacterium]MBT6503323.1 Gfo/Idh/MocA family oxidoreductase [Deltaproteobacteria bacterium]MBT6613739.1 Gfo/Idh/MocA family oxidoreductase [Deltaproteobacteria bacterium]MBT7153921.1 Gfo/Idh/MocA family oxidoreductase [Deltaproteobacteria bacterium]